MELRTFYWNSRKTDLLRYYKYKYLNRDKMVFRHGNAGDIYNIDLIKYLYNANPVNVIGEGNRLLLVGSVMNVLQKGDIVNGIGWKGNEMFEKREVLEAAKVFGIRGPLTRKIFEKCGTDLSQLKFEYDPGLLAKEVYNIDMKNSKEKNVLFIPHYRDLWVYQGKYPKGMKVINIDTPPIKLVEEILKAKIVYSSSLHGVIFSHALNKECVFVAPQTDETIFKFEDYYLSVGYDLPNPVKNIFDFDYRNDKGTVLKKNITREDFFFPNESLLNDEGIMY